MSPTAVLLLCLFIDLVGFGIVVPILPFIVQAYGGGELAGGLLFAVYSGMAALCGPFWGRLSDRIGRRKALVATLLGASVCYVLLGLADSLALVFVARALSGAMAGNVGVVMAAMADLTSVERRTRAMSFIGVSFGLGFAAGPGLAAFLSGLSGANALSLAAFAAAGLSLTAAALAWKRLPAMAAPKAAPKAAGAEAAGEPGATAALRLFMDSPEKLTLLLQFVISAGTQSLVFSMAGFWANQVLGWGEREVGLLMMGVGLVVAVMQGVFVARLADRFGEVGTYLVGLAINIAGAVLILAFPTFLPAILLAFPLMLGGMTLAFPVLNSLMSQRNPAHLQGSALGLANGFSAGGRVIGPTMGGAFMAAYGPGTPFVIVVLASAAGLFWVLSEFRGGRGRPPDPAPSPAPSPAPPRPQGP